MIEVERLGEQKMESKDKRLKYACYTMNVAMSVIGNLSPILFLTFRSMYGISYSLLGLLVLANFVTQLSVDLVFSFFSHRINIGHAVKLTPVLCAVGFLIYGIWPYLFENHVYVGLVIGTVIFSAAGGFVEVLLSPVVAAIPSENPDREISKLHSVYAWGVVAIIVIATLFLRVVGLAHWQWLVFLFTLIPLAAGMLFWKVAIPGEVSGERVSGIARYGKNRELWLCVIAIFLAGASECAMAQWSSGYLEQVFGLPKVWGDVFGVALFAVMMGLGRTLYGKYGKNIGNVLVVGAAGSAVCYLVVSLTGNPTVGLLFCVFNGLCVSMLWPGCVQLGGHRFPGGGVFVYAMMAAGGDLGAALAPQMIGIVTDVVMEAPRALHMEAGAGLTPEQLGMKLGMLVGMLFPAMAIPLYMKIRKKWR